MWHGDTEFRARFDYDPGETERFDAQAGVGNPGREPSVKKEERHALDGLHEAIPVRVMMRPDRTNLADTPCCPP